MTADPRTPRELEAFDEGSVRAAIWARDSRGRVAYTVTVGRREWDPHQGEWWTSGHLTVDDLLPAAVALAKVQERIVELLAKQPARSLFVPDAPAPLISHGGQQPAAPVTPKSPKAPSR